VGQAAEAERIGWVASLVEAFRSLVTPRQGLALAVGAALGVLGLTVLNGGFGPRAGIDSRSFSGTMAPLGSASYYQHISSKQFGLRDARIGTDALSAGGEVVARVVANAPAGSEIVVEFDPSDWTATGVKQEPAGNEVMLGSGRLSVRMQSSGTSQYLLYLARKGQAESPLRISIHSPGGYVQGELATGARRSGS
jgi:hypothetical protein